MKSINQVIEILWALKISDWNKTGWGRIPMSLGFTYSSNTLMMHLQDLVGADKMKSWYERFGFGKNRWYV